MLSPSRHNRVHTPFKTLKDLSRKVYLPLSLLQSPQDDFESSNFPSFNLLKSENIPNIEYTEAIKQLNELKSQIEANKAKEEEIQRELSNLGHYNRQVKMMESQVASLEIKIKEYKKNLGDYNKEYKIFVGIIGLLIAIILMQFFYYD